jgi:hypothetical protein
MASKQELEESGEIKFRLRTLLQTLVALAVLGAIAYSSIMMFASPPGLYRLVYSLVLFSSLLIISLFCYRKSNGLSVLIGMLWPSLLVLQYTASSIKIVAGERTVMICYIALATLYIICLVVIFAKHIAARWVKRNWDHKEHPAQ